MVALLDYPAAEGRPVTDAHRARCREHGHARHLVDGAEGACPRCGEVADPPRVTIEEITAELSVAINGGPGPSPEGRGVPLADWWLAQAEHCDRVAEVFDHLTDWAMSTGQPSPIYIAAVTSRAYYQNDARRCRRDAARERREEP